MSTTSGLAAARPTLRAPLSIRMPYIALWQARTWVNDMNRWRDRERRLQQRLLEHSASFGPGPRLEVPRMKVDLADLPQLKARRRRPIIFEGLLRDLPAVGTWTLDSLKERFGDTHVMCQQQEEAWSIQDLSLAEHIDRIRAGGKSYLFASSRFLDQNAELQADLQLDRVGALMGRKVVRSEVFLGGANVYTPFHCAPGDNMFCQIHGRKRWTLVAPDHAFWLYPDVNPRCTHFFSPVPSEGSQEWPLFDSVPRYVAELEPGDVLYNPSWWWHEVLNLDETIAAALRVGGSPYNAPKMWGLFASAFTLDKRYRGMVLGGVRDVMRSNMHMSDDMTQLAYSLIGRGTR